MRAAIGERELALLVRRRAGERAAHVPEQLRFEQRFRDGGAVHLDERHVALRAAIVNRAGDQLLAGAGLAGDEHRALRLRDELGGPDDILHPAAAPDDAVVVELLVALVEEVPVMGAQALVLQRAPDEHEELVDLERLLKVVERAELHRLDRALDRRVRRHHKNLRPLAVLTGAGELPDQLEARHSRHDVVHDQQVEQALAEKPLRFARSRRRDDLVPVFAQSSRECAEDLRFVVDEQNGACAHACMGWSAPAVAGSSSVHFGPFARTADDGDRAAQPFDDVSRDCKTEARSAALGREVRLEDPRQILRPIPTPLSPIEIATRSAPSRRVRSCTGRRGWRPRLDGVPCVGQADSRGRAEAARRPSRRAAGSDRAPE